MVDKNREKLRKLLHCPNYYLLKEAKTFFQIVTVTIIFISFITFNYIITFILQ